MSPFRSLWILRIDFQLCVSRVYELAREVLKQLEAQWKINKQLFSFEWTVEVESLLFHILQNRKMRGTMCVTIYLLLQDCLYLNYAKCVLRFVHTIICGTLWLITHSSNSRSSVTHTKYLSDMVYSISGWVVTNDVKSVFRAYYL